MIDLKDAELQRENNCCGGPLCCENRKFDKLMLDCQECLIDFEQAMNMTALD